MGSWIRCPCGEMFGKNLFAGNNVFFLLDEDTFGEVEAGRVTLHQASARLNHAVKCPKCGRHYIYTSVGELVSVLAEEPITD